MSTTHSIRGRNVRDVCARLHVDSSDDNGQLEVGILICNLSTRSASYTHSIRREMVLFLPCNAQLYMSTVPMTMVDFTTNTPA